MRIIDITFCSIDTDKYISGVNTWVKNLCLELKNLGHRPHLLILTIGRGEYPLVKFAQNNDIVFKNIQHELFPFAEDKVLKILEIMNIWKTQFFIPGIMSSAHFAIPYLRKANVFSIVVLHSPDKLSKSYLRDFVQTKSQYRADAVISVSEFIHKLSIDVKRPNYAHHIDSGVTIPDQSREQSSHTLKIVYSGRLVQQAKCVRDIYKSFKMTINNFSDVECSFIGNGPEKDYLLERIKKEGKGRINLAGEFEGHQVQNELLKYDVLVLLSDYEGLPLAMLEAMACGLVVICLSVESGVHQVINHMENGIIVTDRENSFLEAVKLLKENPGLRISIGRSARKSITQNFSVNKSARKWVTFLTGFSEKKFKEIRIPNQINLDPNSVGNSYGLSEPRSGASLTVKIKFLISRIAYEILGRIPYNFFTKLKNYKQKFRYLFNR